MGELGQGEERGEGEDVGEVGQGQERGEEGVGGGEKGVLNGELSLGYRQSITKLCQGLIPKNAGICILNSENMLSKIHREMLLWDQSN